MDILGNDLASKKDLLLRTTAHVICISCSWASCLYSIKDVTLPQYFFPFLIGIMGKAIETAFGIRHTLPFEMIHVHMFSSTALWLHGMHKKQVPYFFAVCYTVTFKHFGSIAGLHFAVEPCQTFSQVRATTRFLQGLTEALSQLVAEHMAQADEGADTTFPHQDALK